MAINLRVRLERLEQRRSGGEPLIIRINRFDDEQRYAGVSVNGTITQSRPGQTAIELERQIIDDLERRRVPGVFVIHRVSSP